MSEKVINRPATKKPRKVYTTPKQKRAYEELVVNRVSTGKEAMRKAEYKVTKNIQQVTESKGFQALTAQYLPDDFLLSALYNDIKDKPKNRYQELQLAFKVKGHLKENTIQAKDLTINFDSVFKDNA